MEPEKNGWNLLFQDFRSSGAGSSFFRQVTSSGAQKGFTKDSELLPKINETHITEDGPTDFWKNTKKC